MRCQNLRNTEKNILTELFAVRPYLLRNLCNFYILNVATHLRFRFPTNKSLFNRISLRLFFFIIGSLTKIVSSGLTKIFALLGSGFFCTWCLELIEAQMVQEMQIMQIILTLTMYSGVIEQQYVWLVGWPHERSHLKTRWAKAGLS